MNKLAVFMLITMALLSSCGRSFPAPTSAPTDAIPIRAEETPTPLPATPTPTLTETVPAPTLTPAPTRTPEPISVGPSDFPSNVNPLTGLVVEDPALLDRRPIGIKIDITLRSTRPPFGISFADIIFNSYANGFASRFHAIFYGEDAEAVGGIRSGRLLDDSLVRMYKSIFAFGNADERIRSRYFSSNYTNRLVIEGAPAVCPPTASAPMCRYEPSGVNMLLTGTGALTEFVSKRGVDIARQDLDGMTFHSSPAPGGTPAGQIYTRFSVADYNRLDYDETTGKYLFFQDTVESSTQAENYEPLLDRLNEEQFAVDNVVILVARHDFFQRPPNEIIEIYLTGNGLAYAFRDGQVYEVTWNRPTQDSVLFLAFEDDTRYPFKPGKTLFQVISEGSEVKQENNDWFFKFKYPF